MTIYRRKPQDVEAWEVVDEAPPAFVVERLVWPDECPGSIVANKGGPARFFVRTAQGLKAALSGDYIVSFPDKTLAVFRADGFRRQFDPLS